MSTDESKRRRRGPAPLDATDKRGHTVSVRLNDAELARLDSQRDAVQMQRGEYLRAAALHRLPPTIPAANREATLTSMVGVSVTIIKQPLQSGHPAGEELCYRIWCDGTYGAYLWETLLEIATDLGGGPIGLAELHPDAGRLPHLTL